MNIEKGLRATAGAIARELAHSDHDLLTKLQCLKLLGDSQVQRRTNGAAPAPGPRRVGIWAETDLPGVFRRRVDQRRDWVLWADAEEISAKGSRQRVVLVGESVARGFFYEPEITPTAVLHHLLGSHADAVEVVDLARTDLSAKALLKLLDEVDTLEPDALILFAGNNWVMPGVLDPRQSILLMRAMEKGLTHLRDFVIRECIEDYGRKVLAALDRIAARIPCVVVVPEFNLFDWVDCVLPPEAENGSHAGWQREIDEIKEMMAAGRLAAADRAARARVEREQGLSPLTHRLRGDIMLARGNTKAALAHFSLARDSVCGLPTTGTPRCPAGLQDLLRSAAGRPGVTVVDVAALIARSGQLPDRHLFMDYCHLSLAGIELVMREVASVISRTLLGRPLPLTGAFPCHREMEAMAHLLAAVCNARFGQSREILAYHCRKALELSPSIANEMLALVDFSADGAPDWMSSSFERFIHLPNARRYVERAFRAKEKNPMPPDLLEELLAALQAHGRGAGLETRLAPQRAAGDSDETNLLASASWEHFERGESRAYRRAITETSSFAFWRQGTEPVRISMCCRLSPQDAAKGVVRLHLNGGEIRRFQIGPAWKAFELPVSDALLRPGLNRIVVRWPVRRRRSRGLSEQAVQILRGKMPRINHCFGEIFELKVQRGTRVETGVTAELTP
jgi:hypothetical protein